MFSTLNITIVGLGLMGGSFAKALRNLNPKNIFGIEKDKYVLNLAKQEGTIDNNNETTEDILKISDIIIICVYPNEEVNFIKEYQNIFKDGVILTDISGLKTNLTNEIKHILNENIEFVSTHPMTGKEINGYENSSKDLYLNSNFIVIPIKNTEKTYNVICELITKIGAKKIINSNPNEHDDFIGYTSHLPHILAVALCMDNNFKDSKDYVGRSFKDVSRVANINEFLWSELFIENSENVIKSIENFKENLNILEMTIRDNDINSLRNILRESRERKEEIGY